MKIPGISDLLSPSSKKKVQVKTDPEAEEPVMVETVHPGGNSVSSEDGMKPGEKDSPSTISGATSVDDSKSVWTDGTSIASKKDREGAEPKQVRRTRSQVARLQAQVNQAILEDAAQEDRDEGLDSDADEAMSDFGETEDEELDAESAGARPPLRDLKKFGVEVCRAKCMVQLKSGAMERVICGKLARECNRHAKLRAGGRRADPKFYETVEAKKPKGLRHGKLEGFDIGLKEHYVALEMEKLEMQENIQLQEDAVPDEEKEELQDLLATETSKPKVQFATPRQTLGDIHPLNPRNLETAFETNPKGKTAGATTQPDNNKDPQVPFSMLSELVGSLRKEVAKVTAKLKAKEKQPKQRDRALDGVNEKWEAMDSAERAKVKKMIQEEMPPGLIVKEIDPESDLDYDEKEDHLKKSKRDARRKKATRRKKQRSRRKASGGGGGDDPSSSSSSSSDSDSSRESDSNDGYDSSSSDSTSSTDSEERKQSHRQRKQRSKKRAQRRRAARKKKIKSRPTPRNFSGPDPSVGDKRRVYDMDIMGGEINKVLAPEGMKKAELVGLVDVKRDITSEPGMSGISSGGDDIEDTRDGGTSMIMAEALLATASEGRKRPKDDVLWKREGRHAMKAVKGEDSLFEMASELANIEDDIFKNQGLHLHYYLTRCHYDPEFIQDYLDQGLFPCLIRATYNNYMALFNKARTLQWDHAEEWGSGPASTMFQYHSKKLLQIWMFSRSKKIHLLRTYAYLRDARSKSFMDLAMNKTVWVQLANQQSQLALPMSKAITPDNPDPEPRTKLQNPTGNTQACPHCKSIQLHVRLSLANTKTVCPLKDQTSGTAKKMARKAVRNHNSDKTKEMSAVLAETVTKWIAEKE